MRINLPTIGFVILVGLGLSAKSPAPINDPAAQGAPIAERTQEQLEKEQKFAGGYQATSSAPNRVTESGRVETATIDHQQSAASALAMGSNIALNKGAENIVQATKRVDQEGRKSYFPYFLVLGALALAFAVFKGFQSWMDKSIGGPNDKAYEKESWERESYYG